ERGLPEKRMAREEDQIPSLPVAVYGDASALTNRSAPAEQREPIEQQDDHHYASIHISRSENQEVPHLLAGSRDQSDQTETVL
ncbi:hypothetical protein CRUP_038093, partial [Coryphaenoides rupestris]